MATGSLLCTGIGVVLAPVVGDVGLLLIVAGLALGLRGSLADGPSRDRSSTGLVVAIIALVGVLLVLPTLHQW